MPETGGLLGDVRASSACVLLAYSPIGQGRLTGKYSAANPPPGSRTFSAHPMEQVDEVVAVLRRIGEAHGTARPARSPCAGYRARARSRSPAPRTPTQAEQNAGALGWSLGADEWPRLDAVALEGTRTLQQRIWQHG